MKHVSDLLLDLLLALSAAAPEMAIFADGRYRKTGHTGSEASVLYEGCDEYIPYE